MDITINSEDKKFLDNTVENLKSKCDFTIAIGGNPNVGKSTIFNSLTGMHQHTGNWPGKTVANASGTCRYKNKDFLLVDIPGTYSIISNSCEEEIARDYICFGNPNCTIVVLDATRLERNLNLAFQILEITNNVVVCINLLDEAKKKGININLERLSELLGVPVVGTVARKKKTLNNLMEAVYSVCTGSLKTNIKQINYPAIIEECIDIIEPEVIKILENTSFTNSRWICLKLLDSNSKILQSIEKHLKVKFSKKSLQSKIKIAKEKLLENDINPSDFKDKIVCTILFHAENICTDIISYDNINYNLKDKKIDKILTSKVFGIPIMLAFLAIVFWITIAGANYPSQMLSDLFGIIEENLLSFFTWINSPSWLTGILVSGMYKTLAWVIAVMLPPMAIFFPLFTILEDLGYLPRISFNLDNYFKKACTTGKQALTMCMGFGCNAAGIIGCRIIDSPRERLIAMLTNSFVPCNGRFPFLIIIASVFIGSLFTGIWSSIISTLSIVLVVLIGIFATLLVSKILSKTILKGFPSSYMLELPPYRKPQFAKVFVRSIFDRTLFVLSRAIVVAAPAGIVLWLFANICIGNISILTHVANFLNPFATLMGLDGYILTAFILALPANEIVLPIILMSYMATGTLVDLEDATSIGKILLDNGWTILTGINVMLFSLLHFPCSTTLMTIKKESGHLKWAILSFAIPTVCGIVVCMFTTGIWNLFSLI